jgi:hypothetical protein
MTKHRLMQSIIRQYKDETKIKEVNMHEVAQWAVRKGFKLPTPPNPLDLLAKEFSQAAREEIRYDNKTNRPYRANHAITDRSKQLTLWIDIDEAERKPMLLSLVQRREQIVGDNLQLSFDMEHWNNINPKDEPIDLPLDYTPDVEWR